MGEYRTKLGPITDHMQDKDLPVNRNPENRMSPEAGAAHREAIERGKRIVDEAQARRPGSKFVETAQDAEADES